MKLKNNKKIKAFIFFSVTILVLVSLVGFIALFFNKPLNLGTDATDTNNSNSNNNSDSNQENTLPEDTGFINLDIAQILINNTDVSSITLFDGSNQRYYFSKSAIEKNISNLIYKAIYLTEDFNDDIANFVKNIRFKLSQNNNELIVNLYLYSKLIKEKKYRSFFRLWIIQ